ncbi:phosphotransferase [Leptospira sarikeiensis]|uniref:DUF1679 domain-containing protein n=1 Tax=Leptospira sarikeiensis TaxID=2484943 RepID=A0A4R9KED1_9LEPT|nr:phosphotransferase [Leptospira sarikeiensis]TGL63563.1 DUF1679 domain-containing protein [Leptospira sarikeiensis]
MNEVLGEIDFRFLALDGKFPDKIDALNPEASARRYFRATYPDGNTRILCKDQVFQHDFQEVGHFLEHHGFKVPKIYKTDVFNKLMLLSDEGDSDLTSVQDDAEYRNLLVRSLDILIALQKTRPESPVTGREFDYEKLNFENQFTFSAYSRFSEMFGIQTKLRPEVVFFMQEAAGFLSEYPEKVFCHRDFHARNIMLSEKGELTLIDFQDARLGTPFYDLASLLYDAYRPIPFAMRQGLFLLFLKLSDNRFSRAKECYYLQCLQRSYKALGSYFMLVADKKQDKYRKSILNCLDNLIEIVQVGLFPDQLFLFFHLLKKELTSNSKFSEKL